MDLALPGHPLCLMIQRPVVVGDPGVATLEGMTGWGTIASKHP